MAKFVLSHLAHLFLEAGPNLDGLQSPLPPPLYFTSAAAASMKNISLVTLRLYAWKKPTEIKSTLVPTLFNSFSQIDFTKFTDREAGMRLRQRKSSSSRASCSDAVGNDSTGDSSSTPTSPFLLLCGLSSSAWALEEVIWWRALSQHVCVNLYRTSRISEAASLELPNHSCFCL